MAFGWTKAGASWYVYGVMHKKELSSQDLWYWTFYPFNYGKPVGPFGFLGHHVSDWERVRVRTLNGSAISVDYSEYRVVRLVSSG